MNKKIDDFVSKTQNKVNYDLEDTLLDSEVTIDEIKNYKYKDLVQNNTKAKISKIPWLLSIFIILIVAFIFVCLFLNGNPQTIFTNTIDKFFMAITDNISDNNYEISKGNIKAKLNLDGSLNSSLFKEISKYDFDISYVLDNANGLFNSNIKTKYENNDYWNLNVVNDKNYIYFYSEDLYDKYIKIFNDNDFKVIRSSDLKSILNSLNQAFDKVATSEKIIGSKTNMDLGVKSIRVYESKLIIDSHNYKRVSETFVNSLKSNEEFVTSLANMRGTSSGNVKKALNRFLPLLDSFFKKCDTLSIKLYNDRKTKDFIKCEIDFNYGGFILSKFDNKVNFSFVNNVNKVNFTGDFIFDINKKRTKYNFNINFVYKKNDKVILSLDSDLFFSNNKASSFRRQKVDDAVLYDDLSDEDKNKIVQNLNSKFSIGYFIK